MNWFKISIISLLALSALLVLYSEFLVDCENKRTGTCSSKSQRMMGAMAFTSFAVASILFLYMYFKSSGGNNRTPNMVNSVNNARFRSGGNVPNSMGSVRY